MVLPKLPAGGINISTHTSSNSNINSKNALSIDFALFFIYLRLTVRLSQQKSGLNKANFPY
jgi:hypothetical protein